MVSTSPQADPRAPGATIPPLRIVFFGTPAFAVPTLDALLAAAPHAVVGVVTQPDRPRGRGHRLSDAPVKARAIEAALPLLQPERMKDEAFLQTLSSWTADLGVVAAYGRILTDEILAIPRLGMINVHGSLLPRYRGAAPVHRAIIDGEVSTGITIMRVVKALDAGPMLASDHRAIGPDETSEEVERDLARIGSRLLVAVVDQIAQGHARETPQDDALATYAHRLTKDDGIIDWTSAARRVHNLIRGLHPWPHAFSFVQGKRIILRRSAIATPGPKGPGLHTSDETPVEAIDPPRPKGPDVQAVEVDVGRVLLDPPGTIVEADGDRLIVATGDGVLRILEMQAEGKRPMGVREFLAGHRLTAGERFTAAP
jgi:methionyl-tRNA formyltransferase